MRTVSRQSMSEKQLPSMHQIGTQFIAHSGMEEALSNGILVGRPFGGVSICWSPDLDHLISPLSNFRHKRVVGIELKTVKRDVLLLNVYMPYFNSARRAECIAETLDVISMLETIIEQHPNDSLGGDIHSELKGESPFDSFRTDFMSTNQFLKVAHVKAGLMMNV